MHGGRCSSGLDQYCSNLLGLFVRNGTARALEGHNIPRTSLIWTSEYVYCREAFVFTADVVSAYASDTRLLYIPRPRLKLRTMTLQPLGQKFETRFYAICEWWNRSIASRQKLKP